MKELITDEKFKKLFKPLGKEELENLEKGLSKKYDGTPLYVWKGNIIVDGHNRYPIMKKYNIDFNVENVEDFLGKDCTRADIMQWMLSHQKARRNLTAGESLHANQMIMEEIELENKQKKSEGGRIAASIIHGKVACNHVVASQNSRERSTNTREQLAKMSGVGVGTAGRYQAIMKTDNEELKQKVNTGEVPVGTAYREIKTRVCKVCGKEKKIIDFFGNDTTCKDCTRKAAKENENALRMMSYKPSEENMKLYEYVTTARNAKDYINQDTELDWLRHQCKDFLGQVNDKFFDLLCAVEKMDLDHIKEANIILDGFISDVCKIQERFSGEEENK